MKTTQIAWPILSIISMIILYCLTKVNLSPYPYIILFLVVVALLFCRLTIKVNNHTIRIIYGIGIIRRSFNTKDIRSCKACKYFTTGWGIRIQKNKTIYNVSGNKGVEIHFKNKKRSIIIGSQNAEKTATYINSKIAKL